MTNSNMNNSKIDDAFGTSKTIDDGISNGKINKARRRESNESTDDVSVSYSDFVDDDNSLGDMSSSSESEYGIGSDSSSSEESSLGLLEEVDDDSDESSDDESDESNNDDSNEESEIRREIKADTAREKTSPKMDSEDSNSMKDEPKITSKREKSKLTPRREDSKKSVTIREEPKALSRKEDSNDFFREAFADDTRTVSSVQSRRNLMEIEPVKKFFSFVENVRKIVKVGLADGLEGGMKGDSKWDGKSVNTYSRTEYSGTDTEFSNNDNLINRGNRIHDMNALESHLTETKLKLATVQEELDLAKAELKRTCEERDNIQEKYDSLQVEHESAQANIVEYKTMIDHFHDHVRDESIKSKTKVKV